MSIYINTKGRDWTVQYIDKQRRKRTLDTQKRMTEREREVKGIEREREILVKSPKPRNKAQTKVDYTKLSLVIMTRNYQLVYYVTQK